MADFDLSQLRGNGKGPNGVKPNNNPLAADTIDVTAGKVQRVDGTRYVSASQNRAKNGSSTASSSTDPIFDTPPTFKVGGSRDKNFQSINEDSTMVSYGANRTPVHAGSPKTQAPVIHSIKDDKMDVPDPTPLKVVDNFAHPLNANSGDLTPFDLSSLPKKKQEMGQAESEDMDNLAKAVDRECESISERVRALTEKQHEEFLDAQAEGKKVARPLTDEELAAQEEARINGTKEEEEVDVENIGKTIVIAGDEDEEVPEDNSVRKEAFEDTCMNAVKYVENHVTSKDYFTRTMHARSYLEKLHIYSELWAIVMFNKEMEAAIHPFLVAKKDGITAIIEVNIDNLKGVHTLDPNDTIEGLYVQFLHKGYLYEYIDYLHKNVVLKLPTDMPTAENALKMANKKLGAKEMSENNTTPTIEESVATPEVADELDAAINKDEAKALYGDVEEQTPTVEATEEYLGTTSGSDGISREFSFEPEVKEETTSTEAYTEPEIPVTYEMDYPVSGETVEEPSIEESSPVEEEPEAAEETVSEPEEDEIVISKEFEGAEAYQAANSDDLAKDLETELNVDTETGRSDEEMLEELKAAVKKNIPAIKNKINLRDFKISDTPISASKVSSFSISDVNQADWVLPNAQKVITVRGLSGPELFAMNPQNSNKNRINTFRQIYGIIYKHIVSKKPKSFDEWLKITRFSDIDHIYAALHRATFSGSNFVHYECPECQHVFIKDYDFEDMVQYRDDEAKAKIHRILNSGDSSIAGYKVKLSQISDNYVIGLKDPSIWNMVMETAALSEDFLSKYEDLMDTMSFIDSVYVIDREHGQLKPVDFDYDKDNPAKSTARKIMILSEIIRTLSSDNYFDLRNQIAQLFASSNDMTYKIPEAECPNCHHKFPMEPTEGMRMLFTRHQLGALGVI